MPTDPLLQQSNWRLSDKVQYSDDGTKLIWSRPFREVSWDLHERDPWDDFVKIAAEPFDPETLLRVARMHGPLLLCSHGLPRTHLKVRNAEEAGEDLFMSHGVRQAFQRPRIVEEVAAWRSYARQAEVVIQIASDLRKGTPAQPELWRVLRPLLPAVANGAGLPLMESEQSVDAQRRALAVAVQTWLDWGDVGAACMWESQADGKEPGVLRIRMGASTLFGSLALSLALAVSRAPGSVTCAACHRDFVPTRPRRPDQRAWCDREECQRVRNRQDVKKFRDKDKAKKAAAPNY